MKLGSRRVPLGASPDLSRSPAGLTLVPNPAGHVRALLTEPTQRPTHAQVLDALGRKVRHVLVAIGAMSVELPLAGLPAGVYTVRVGASTQRLVVG